MAVIETERLILRTLSEHHASEKYVNWLNDPEVNQYLETRHREQTLEDCKEFIKSCNGDPSSHLFGIFEKRDNVHIGNAKIGFINQHYQRGQVSIFIGEKECWGKGFSTEVVRALTKYGFADLELHRLEAGCYEENLASLRVFLKNGYTVEGFMRDQVILDGRRIGCFWLGILKHEFTG